MNGAHEPGTPVSLMLCDLDGLKSINDGQGHEAGDRALRNVAETLVRCAAGLPGAFVARLAGDEFCVLMEERGLDEAISLSRGVVEDLADGTGESLSCGAASTAGPTKMRRSFWAMPTPRSTWPSAGVARGW